MFFYIQMFKPASQKQVTGRFERQWKVLTMTITVVMTISRISVFRNTIIVGKLVILTNPQRFQGVDPSALVIVSCTREMAPEKVECDWK